MTSVLNSLIGPLAFSVTIPLDPSLAAEWMRGAIARNSNRVPVEA